MRRNKKVFLAGTMMLMLLVSLALAVLSARADDFASEHRPNSPRVERRLDVRTAEQETSKRDQPRKQYSLHDQLVRLAFLLVFMGVAGLTIKRAQYKHRKIILVASVAVLGLFLGGFLCPFSAIQNAFTKWQTGYLLLFLTVLVSALLVGRVFCGYICPFGAIQELLHLKRVSRAIPFAWDRYLTKAKYVLLGYLVVRVLITREVILQDYDPFKALFAWGGAPLSISLTFGFAILSLVMYRPYCRYVCPLGTFLVLVSRFSLFRVRIEPRCIDCGLCEKVCESRAIVGTSPTVVSAECIVCGDCLEKCPKEAITIARTRIQDLSLTHLVLGPTTNKNTGETAK